MARAPSLDVWDNRFCNCWCDLFNLFIQRLRHDRTQSFYHRGFYLYTTGDGYILRHIIRKRSVYSGKIYGSNAGYFRGISGKQTDI